MPFKRNYRSYLNRKRRYPYRSNFKKRINRKRNTKYFANKGMISYMAPLQQPMPPRYRCKFSIGAQFNVDPAQNVASGSFRVDMNNIREPFSPSGLDAVPYANFAPGTAATLNPANYSALVNAQLYQKYRVYSSKMILKVIPSAQADTVMVTVVPALSTTGPTSTGTALAQPFCKSRLFQSSQIGVISNYIAQHTLAGTTRRAIEDDLSNRYMGRYTNDTIEQFYWFVNWNTVDAINLSTPLIFEVKMEYYCELFSDVSAQTTQT